MRKSALLEEAREEGRQEGRLEGARENLLILLEARFGAVPPDVAQRVQTATDDEWLQAALRRVLTAQSPDEVLS